MDNEQRLEALKDGIQRYNCLKTPAKRKSQADHNISMAHGVVGYQVVTGALGQQSLAREGKFKRPSIVIRPYKVQGGVTHYSWIVFDLDGEDVASNRDIGEDTMNSDMIDCQREYPHLEIIFADRLTG